MIYLIEAIGVTEFFVSLMILPFVGLSCHPFDRGRLYNRIWLAYNSGARLDVLAFGSPRM